MDVSSAAATASFSIGSRRRIDEQLQQERGDESADHRRRDALHHVGSGPVDHMIGRRPINAAQTVIALGRTRFTAPWTIASSRSPVGVEQPALPRLVVGEVEEEEHEDAGLGVEAHERDHPDPGGDRDVVAEEVEEPDRAHRRERHRQHHHAALNGGLVFT